MKKNAILTYSSIAVAVLALIIGIVLFALNKKEESYRNIAISEINHVKTAVTRGESTYDAYEGMLLR